MAAVGANVAAEFDDPVSANWYIAAWITAITIGFTIWQVGPRLANVGSSANHVIVVQTRTCSVVVGF